MDLDKDKWQQLWQEVVEKKKLDPVGKADADIDNDGDVDKSDDYLHNRRKAIKKAMKKEGDGMTPCPDCGGSMENHDPECPRYEKAEKAKMNKEANDLDTKNAEKVLRHDCASHVTHEQWGYGECIPGEHTLVESADGEGYVTHYDVMFQQGIVFNVPVEELNIIRESSHGHMKRKKKESTDLDAKSADKALRHDCASHVTSEKYGFGLCVPGQHTLEETTEGEGVVTHYDVMFEEHGLIESVPVEELTVVKEKSHMHASKQHKMKKEEVEAVAEGTVAEVEQEIEQAYSGLQQAAINAMRQMWTEKYNEDPKVKSDRAAHVKGATPTQDMHDLEPKKGKDFIDQHKQSDKSIEDMETKSHDDVSKAARAVAKQSPTRQGEKRVGDLKPEMPQDTTKV